MNHVVATIRVPHWTAAVAVGAHYVWVVSEPRSAGGVVTRINPSSDRAVSRKIPHSWIPAAVAVVGKRVWIADPGVAQLIGLDARQQARRFARRLRRGQMARGATTSRRSPALPRTSVPPRTRRLRGNAGGRGPVSQKSRKATGATASSKRSAKPCRAEGATLCA
jgi:hypothetical protein